ncbi:UPF0481 protein At3g47200-like [Momordica charantia]|uniref:UPF0481 protein At3g47200-like n=1 Tax=Momordica charantia TaxID=3673 RepID=A0A6J1CA62_MOMCH|nr:UPF0481 protein At3g47200-like [Momordica charantia]XP_022138114.1 UPF0481 protein At3g47200-like [Momordica charantia]
MNPSRALSHAIDIPAISRERSDEESLLCSMEAKMEAFCSSIIIFKVPDEISIDNREVFVPAKVSIGPFHHGAPHLESMEDLKWNYLCAFLKHNPSVGLDDLLEFVAKSESRVRKCYEVEFHDLDSQKFARMMVLDCCFVLELLLRFSIKRLKRRNDPVFTTPGLLLDLKSDLILLENQIPYFLLREVYEKVQDSREENMPLNDLAFRFFRTIVAGERQSVYDNFQQDADHLLDIVHSCFLSTYPRIETKNNKSKTAELPRASKLKSAGIKFKNAVTPKSVLDIKFQNGGLEIPTLEVSKHTETILKNLIAYEICQIGSAQQVKSYVDFMSHLLQSDEDMKLLCGRKILINLEKDETQIIANLKWMRQQKANLSGTYFAGVVQKLNEPPDRFIVWWRRLRRNPVAIGVVAVWALVVIFVAAFFSALSLLQRRYR